MAEPVSSWADVGVRVARARAAAKLDPVDLATRAGLPAQTVVTLERGEPVPVTAVLRLAQALGVPLEELVTEPPPSVVSWRASGSSTETIALEQVVERVVRSAELLRGLGALRLAQPPALAAPGNLKAAEQAAAQVRAKLGHPQGPLHDLAARCEDLGLLTFVTALGGGSADGAYVALPEGGGVAVLSGDLPAGRRRFTLAHELAHHVFQDAYATDWLAEGLGGERLLNAFAVHLLLPRTSLQQAWAAAEVRGEQRTRAIRLAVEYRVSWTPLCNQLRTLDLIDDRERDALLATPPRAADYLELELEIAEELVAPYLSPRFKSAVIRALRAGKITRARARELLWDTVEIEELPRPDPAPLESFVGELGDSAA